MPNPATMLGRAAARIGEKILTEAIGEFSRWHQKSRNGLLPIGIAQVGKTTFLTKFDLDSPRLFLHFNRTLEVTIDKLRLRQEFLERCKGVEYYKKIDVPGDLPHEWARAYFDANPRVLVVMVDERSPDTHIKQLRTFLKFYAEGPTVWQRTKTIFGFRMNNLARVLFVANKADRLPDRTINSVSEAYRGVLADFQSKLRVPIQMFQTTLTSEAMPQTELFHAVLDGFTRK